MSKNTSSQAVTDEYLNDIAKIVFEEHCGREYPWDGVQHWVIQAMKEAFNRGAKLSEIPPAGVSKSLAEAFSQASGYRIKTVSEAIKLGEADVVFTGFSDFKEGFRCGVMSSITAVEESQPPETTPWDCVDAIRRKLEV